MCEEKSNGGTTTATTRHTLVDWLLHAGPSLAWRRKEEAARQLVGLLAAAAVYVCGFSSLRFERSLLGLANLSGISVRLTQPNPRISRHLSLSVPLPSPSPPPPPPWVFGFINTLRRSQSVPDISAKAEASSFLWVKNSRDRF